MEINFTAEKENRNAFTSLNKRQVHLKDLFFVWHEYQADWIDEAAFKLIVPLFLFYILSAFNSGNSGKLELDHFPYTFPWRRPFQPQ